MNQQMIHRLRAVIVASAAVALTAAPALAGDLLNNTNVQGVQNGGQSPSFVLTGPAHIDEIDTYHWNNGQGARPGAISLRLASGQFFGPWQAQGSAGQGGAPNVNWTTHPGVDLPAGTYQVIDSDPRTWSQNPQSRGQGFTIVRGTYVAAKPGPGPVPSRPGPPSPAPRPAPPLPAPKPAPPAPTAALPLPNPCHANSASLVELAKPTCFGPPGTTITLYVSRYGLKMKPTVAVFQAGSIGQMLFPTQLPYGPALLQEPLTLVKGDGLQPGSLYTTTIPAGACMTGAHHTWYYDVKIPQNQALATSVDVVGVSC